MLRIRRWTAIAFLVVVGVAAPAPAQESPLAQVPADAPIVVQLKGVQRTKDRLTTLIKNALPEMAPMVQGQIDAVFAATLQGRNLKGAAPDGPVFLAFTSFPKPGETPTAALIARVTTYADFRNGLLTAEERKGLKSEGDLDVATIQNQTVYLVDRKNGYAVLAADKDTAQRLAKQSAGLDGKLSKVLAKKLLDADAAWYVDMAAVNREFGVQIQFGRQLLDVVLQQGALGNAQVDQESVKKVFNALFQGVADSQALLFALDFRPEGFALSFQDQFAAQSKTNDVLKGGKPGAIADMGRLPAGRAIYYGMQIDSTLIDLMQTLLFGIHGVDEKTSNALKAAVTQLVAAKPEQRYDALDIPIQGMTVWKFGDPAKGADSLLKLVQALNAGDSYQQAVLKGKPEVRVSAEKHRGFDLHYVRLAWDLDKLSSGSLGGQNLPEEQKKQLVEVMRQMMGEGMQLWFGSNGKIVIQAVANNWDAARQVIDQYLDGKNTAGQGQGFQSARKQLPAEASFLALLDFTSYSKVVFGVIKVMLQGQLPLPPNYPAAVPATKPSYVGVDITLQPENGGFDIWIPATAVNDSFKMFVAPLIK